MKRFSKPTASVLLTVAFLSSLPACQHTVHSSANQNTGREDVEKDPELALLRKYGWSAEGGPTESMLTLPRPVTAQLSTRLYSQASKAIGLDFSDRAGETLPLHTYKVTNDAERGHDIRAHLLVAEEKTVGAWLSVEGEEIAPGVYPLNVQPHKGR
jgi:hypothetical protein